MATDDDIAPSAVPSSVPAQRARALLSSALGQLQMARAGQVESVVELAAEASNALYEVEHGDSVAATSRIHFAVERLGACLEKLQAHSGADPAVDVAVETIAKTLAILYPVARAQQRQRREVVFRESPVRENAGAAKTRVYPPAPAQARPRRRTPPYRGTEHRGVPRVLLEVDVGLVSASHFYTGLSGDLSRGGLFVATYRPQPPGSRLDLCFVLPDGTMVETAGVVTWTREQSGDTPPGMGVRFEGLSEGARGAIEKFCEQRAPLYHDSADD